MMDEYPGERSYRGPLKALILDWAGTTVDYGSRAPAAAFVEVFAQRGVEISIQEAREPMGRESSRAASLRHLVCPRTLVRLG